MIGAIAARQPFVPISSNPLDASLNRDSVKAVTTQIVVAVMAAVLIVLILVLYTFFRRVPRVKALLRDFDIFYDLVHYVREGAPQSRESRALGGLFSVLALVVMVLLLSVAIIQYWLVLTYIRSVSPNAAPFQPVGIFNFSMRLYSAPACQSPNIQGPTSAQLQGIRSQGWQLHPDRSCSMYWDCANCEFIASTLTTSFTMTDPNVYAAGMDYTLTFPGFSTSAAGSGITPPFVLSSLLWTDSPLLSVFRGSSATEIGVSLVPVVVRTSTPEVGTFAQLIGVVPGSQVNGVTLPLYLYRLPEY